MKTSISFFLVFAAFTTTFSQTEKGRLSISGGVLYGGISKTKSETVYPGAIPTRVESKNMNIALTPGAGFFVADNFLLGIGLNYSLSRTKTATASPTAAPGNFSSTSFTGGPYAQYFFGQSAKGRPYIQASPRIGTTVNKYRYEDGSGYHYKNSGFTWSGSASAGYALFLNDSFFVSFFATYSHTHYSTKYDYPTTAFVPYKDVDKTNGFYLGVSVNNTFKK